MTVEHVREKIIHGFGTGLDEVDYLDLMNVATMLLIPTCCKAAAAVTEGLPSNLIKPRDGLLQFVLDMILHDVRTGTLIVCFWGDDSKSHLVSVGYRPLATIRQSPSPRL